ncbi:hypothetical protein MES5069_270240 [Mesorhizobium escarrei]|uniref:Uncharacterized protein n=1 Tax=Mesorhizobium escarrei TaxID=666018 RepID=A0ABN8JSQ4_9HYPH|nr:hypothetical protein MES5069_270240 [Mesorhizobium escarrei]
MHQTKVVTESIHSFRWSAASRPPGSPPGVTAPATICATRAGFILELPEAPSFARVKPQEHSRFALMLSQRVCVMARQKAAICIIQFIH